MDRLDADADAISLNNSADFQPMTRDTLDGASNQGGWRSIAPEELHRTLPPLGALGPEDQGATSADHVKVIDEAVKSLRKISELLSEQLDDTRTDRDRWQCEASHWRNQALSLLPPPIGTTRPWWKRIAG